MQRERERGGAIIFCRIVFVVEGNDDVARPAKGELFMDSTTSERYIPYYMGIKKRVAVKL